MVTRNSGYARLAGDSYWTPTWCFDALFDVETFRAPLLDPAPRNHSVDFLGLESWRGDICTNPPFSLADQFIRHSLELTRHAGGKVAMLLPVTFDCAKGRRDLWAAPFKAKYTLTTRIRWLNLDQKKSGPSSNHAWFVFDHAYVGRPTMGWLPVIKKGKEDDNARFSAFVGSRY
jgi:hypothetical protein